MQPQAAAFLYALRFAGDRAEGTCRTYAHPLSLFFTWVSEAGRDWTAMGADDLASFVLWLERTPSRRGRRGRGRSRPDVVRLAGGEPVRAASTVNGVTTAVRELYRWLADHDQFDPRLAGRLSASRMHKKHPQRRPQHLGVEQVRALMAGCTNDRDRFLVMVMWRCGLRLSEALGLRREDVHFLPSSEHVAAPCPEPMST